MLEQHFGPTIPDWKTQARQYSTEYSTSAGSVKEIDNFFLKLGITTGLFLVSLVNTTIILAQDWQYLSLQARMRLSIHDVQPNHNGQYAIVSTR